MGIYLTTSWFGYTRICTWSDLGTQGSVLGLFLFTQSLNMDGNPCSDNTRLLISLTVPHLT